QKARATANPGRAEKSRTTERRGAALGGCDQSRSDASLRPDLRRLAPRVPVPGETTLIAWALYAGTFHTLDIGHFIVAAAIGAIAGNILGYFIGRSVGYRLLVQHGSRIGFSESRFKIGHYLFRHYGIAAVIAGRFLPLLRSALPILAGANRMAFWPFLFASVAGGIAWVTLVGLAACYFGVALIQL